MENFGEYVQKCRESRCYKLREFAEIIEISPYYLSMIENGKKKNPAHRPKGRQYCSLAAGRLYCRGPGPVRLDVSWPDDEYFAGTMLGLRQSAGL